MVSEFGHLCYLYTPSHLKFLPLLTVKLLSSPKLKEPVLVRLRMNDRTTLRSSVHFCTHLFCNQFACTARSTHPNFQCSASHYRALRIDLTIRTTFSAKSVLCAPFRQLLPRIHRVLSALLLFTFATASHTCVDHDYWIASVTRVGHSVCTNFCS